MLGWFSRAWDAAAEPGWGLARRTRPLPPWLAGLGVGCRRWRCAGRAGPRPAAAGSGARAARPHHHRQGLPFLPRRVEVGRDDLLRLTVKSEDVAYGFTIDEYRVSKRVPAGGSVVLELRADREGTFPFYSNMTSDSRHASDEGRAGRPPPLEPPERTQAGRPATVSIRRRPLVNRVTLWLLLVLCSRFDPRRSASRSTRWRRCRPRCRRTGVNSRWAACRRLSPRRERRLARCPPSEPRCSCATKPPVALASSRQSTAPLALTISQALLPLEADVTVNRAHQRRRADRQRRTAW